MKPNENFSVKQMKEYIRAKKINHPDVKLSMKRADMIAGLKKAGHWDSSVKKTTKSKSKPAPKKATPKPKSAPKKSISDEEYMKMVNDNNKNHPVGDTILQITIKGKMYDWNGIDVMDGFGKKVGELKNVELLKKWNEGILNKYNVPEVSKGVKMMTNVPKKLDENKIKNEKLEKQLKEIKQKEEEEKKRIKPLIEKITKITKSAKFKSKKSFDTYLRNLTRGNDEKSKLLDTWFYGAQNWVVMDGLKEAKKKFLDTIDHLKEYNNGEKTLKIILERLEKT